jgi:outer membrane lipoprotein SlyB
MHTAASTVSGRFSQKVLIGLLFAPAVFLAGCATQTETGALAGAGIGGLGGAAIGSLAHAPVAGAAIGAAAGALTGAAVGNSEDRKQERAAAAAAQARALGMTDVAQMAQQGVSEAIIINQIRTSPTIFHLSATDITWLRENRVSDAVIAEMQNTALRQPRRVYVEGAAVYQPAPVVVYEEPPPVGVGIGIGYTHYRRW